MLPLWNERLAIMRDGKLKLTFVMVLASGPPALEAQCCSDRWQKCRADQQHRAGALLKTGPASLSLHPIEPSGPTWKGTSPSYSGCNNMYSIRASYCTWTLYGVLVTYGLMLPSLWYIPGALWLSSSGVVILCRSHAQCCLYLWLLFAPRVDRRQAV